jgi:ribosomal protection tetracycline resistance protein
VLRRTLNLGILAHVDAGKTTLTERLLYAAGVIDALGNVDKGTTQTDSLALERRRGITIRSAVVSFRIGDVAVNLIDTPGHPDFIAEVERVLGVLDGAVLVVSAVEGVQPQTRILMRALRRLRIPTLVFVNKIDRPGAREDGVLAEIAASLTPAVVPLGTTERLGTPAADFAPGGSEDVAFHERLAEALAERDESILEAYVDGGPELPYPRLREELAAQTGRAALHPVVFGSARTGAGVVALMAGIAELLPGEVGKADGPASGVVFKVDRGPAGEKIAYARMFSGTVKTRDRLRYGSDGEDKVTAIRVFEDGSDVSRPAAVAGEIARVWGLGEIRIGDRIGELHRPAVDRQFAPPTLETVVAPRDPADAGALRVALVQLAEQDPLIDVRQDDERQEISVSLYGEVQKEVVETTLADDFGLPVTFSDTTPIYVERPRGSGEAVEVLHAESNRFLATIGLRVDAAVAGSGAVFRLHVEPRAAPLYLYKTLASFEGHMRDYVHDSLREGLFGWRVTDCLVTMTRCAYSVPDGPPSRRGPLSTAADFRKLTPLVLMRALERAGTVVCEPMVRATLEAPADSLGALFPALTRLGAVVETPSHRDRLSTIEAVLPAARVHELQRQLPGLTGGEGVVDFEFAGYEPVGGEPPVRRRRRPSPLDRGEHPMRLGRRVGAAR